MQSRRPLSISYWFACGVASCALACGLTLDSSEFPADVDASDADRTEPSASSSGSSGASSSSSGGSSSGSSSSSSSSSGGSSSGDTPPSCDQDTALGSFVPLAITSGMTHDVVADSVPAAGSASAMHDDYALFSQSYLDARNGPPSGARPLAQSYADGAHTFQLQPFNGSNVLRLPATGNSVYPLAVAPTRARALSVLLVSVYGDTTLRVVVKYQDGTEAPAQEVFVPRFALPDGPPGVAFSDFDRIRLDGAFVPPSPRYLHALDLTLPPEHCAKQVSGLEFQRVADADHPQNAVYVFAVSAAP